MHCTGAVQCRSYSCIRSGYFVFFDYGSIEVVLMGHSVFDLKLMWALIKLQFDVANTFEIIGDSLVFNCILKLIFFGFRSLID